MLVPGSEDGTPQSIQDRVLDETHPVGTQLDSPPSDVPAASKRDLGAGPLRPVFDLTVDDSDGRNVGQECDAVPHVSSVCRGRFAVAEEDTVEQGVSPVSGSSFRHQNHDARQMIPPSGDSAIPGGSFSCPSHRQSPKAVVWTVTKQCCKGSGSGLGHKWWSLGPTQTVWISDESRVMKVQLPVARRNHF